MSSGGRVRVEPSRLKEGLLSVPGDKSISQRSVMLASLASGESRIQSILRGGDVLSTLSACQALGASARWENDNLLVTGTSGMFRKPLNDLDMGNSGTGMRLMSGLLAGHAFTSTFTGDASLSKRPMTRILVPLELMGARLTMREDKYPPFTLHGGGLSAISYELPMASAQVKSCVLLAGLFADGDTSVVEPIRCRDHTENMFEALGLPLLREEGRSTISGSGGAALSVPAFDWKVPGDFSSAAFWLVAAAISDGVCISVSDVGLNSGRSGLLGVLERMGAEVTVSIDPASAPTEPYGTVSVTGRGLIATEVGADEVPNLIDELPLVAVLGACAEGETVIKGAAELRVKESDRIALMVTNLRAVGVDVEERPDGMVLRGSTEVQGGATVSSQGDHRMAMSMAILATRTNAAIEIEGTDCIATSYPTFWDDRQRVTVNA